MNNPADLQNDWPADSTNDELVRLAEQLSDVAPPLPPESLARVGQQVDAELDREERWRRRRRIAFGWSIAAAVLLAVGGYVFFRPSPRIVPQLAEQNAVPQPVLIEDRVLVAVGDGAGPATGKPLVRLEENRSLFAD